MMGDGTTVSTTPMEWRSRVYAVARARSAVSQEDDIGRRMLLLREQLKAVLHAEGKSAGRAKRSIPRQLVGQRSK